MLLKKKKFYENNLKKTDGQLDNIDQMIHTLEFTQIEHEVMRSMKQGNESLKQLNEMMSLDEIEDIMDDTREAIEHQRVRISFQIFAKKLTFLPKNQQLLLNGGLGRRSAQLTKLFLIYGIRVVYWFYFIGKIIFSYLKTFFSSLFRVYFREK